jgi:hypothetical protein
MRPSHNQTRRCVGDLGSKIRWKPVPGLSSWPVIVFWNLRVCLEHKNFTGITQKFYMNLFIFTEKTKEREKIPVFQRAWILCALVLVVNLSTLQSNLKAPKCTLECWTPRVPFRTGASLAFVDTETRVVTYCHPRSTGRR